MGYWVYDDIPGYELGIPAKCTVDEIGYTNAELDAMGYKSRYIDDDVIEAAQFFIDLFK